MKGCSKNRLWLLGQSSSRNIDLKKATLCQCQPGAAAATVVQGVNKDHPLRGESAGDSQLSLLRASCGSSTATGRSERDCWCNKPRMQCSSLFCQVFWST